MGRLMEARKMQVKILDPSEHSRPKEKNSFREYSLDKDDPIQRRVRETYRKMHKNQTVQFVKDRIEYWTKFDKEEMTIMEALNQLNSLIDESDPDVDVPNIVHAFQTAESLRKDFPNEDWLHLTGLIHDLGKVLALLGEPQWSVVGDTYPVGCEFASTIVYRETSFDGNLDLNCDQYNTKFGIYKENCGLDNVLMSWGHDEYLYRVLRNHLNCKLPDQALFLIRFHSFYPLHFNDDYHYLCNENDFKKLPLLKKFNQYDLYTKSNEKPDIESLLPYYNSLIEKYIPGKVKW